MYKAKFETILFYRRAVIHQITMMKNIQSKF